jgi:hypothetical protein
MNTYTSAKNAAAVVEVKVEFYRGRYGKIFELFVPELKCSFNTSECCGKRGHVIFKEGPRGKMKRTVQLSNANMEQLREWKKCEEMTRKAKENAMKSCRLDDFFSKIEITNHSETYSSSTESHWDWDNNCSMTGLSNYNPGLNSVSLFDLAGRNGYFTCVIGEMRLNTYTRLYFNRYVVKIQSLVRRYLVQVRTKNKR